jgi:hypothetical protein
LTGVENLFVFALLMMNYNRESNSDRWQILGSYCWTWVIKHELNCWTVLKVNVIKGEVNVETFEVAETMYLCDCHSTNINVGEKN